MANYCEYSIYFSSLLLCINIDNYRQFVLTKLKVFTCANFSPKMICIYSNTSTDPGKLPVFSDCQCTPGVLQGFYFIILKSFYSTSKPEEHLKFLK